MDELGQVRNEFTFETAEKVLRHSVVVEALLWDKLCRMSQRQTGSERLARHMGHPCHRGKSSQG